MPVIPSDIGDWWGCPNMGFEGVESIGNSTGILSFWDTSNFQKIVVIKPRYLLFVVGYWSGISGETIFVNVYAPQAPAEKRLLWSNLLNFMSSRPGNWILFGDFNVV